MSSPERGAKSRSGDWPASASSYGQRIGGRVGKVGAVLDDEDMAQVGQVGQERRHQGRELALVDERLEVGVGQEIPQLVFDVAVVDVDPHGPQLEDGPGRLDPLDAVVGVDADMVPGSDALGGQMVGQPIGPGLHLGVGAALPVGDQVFTLGIGVDCRLEEVGEVALHRATIRTGSRSGGKGGLTLGCGARVRGVLGSGPKYPPPHGLSHRRVPLHRGAGREGVGLGVRSAPDGRVVARERGGHLGQRGNRPGGWRALTGRNKNGFRRWSTTATVVACEPGRVFEIAITTGTVAHRQLAL